MKHIKFIYCLLFLFPCTASAMSQDLIELVTIIHQSTPTQPSPHHYTSYDIVDILDKAIQKKYPQTNPLIDYFSNLLLPQKELLTILNIPFDSCKNTELLTFSVFEALRGKNNSFKEAIDYFLMFARKNIDDVNHKTLDTVGNSNDEQPIPKLNLLPSLIKKYVMLLARNEIKLTYEIKLEHSDEVLCFDICPSNHTIVTQSLGKVLRLWNLNTGQYIASLPEENYLDMLKFNGDGSLLATTAYFNDLNQSYINIWNTSEQKLLSVIPLTDQVYHIDFAQEEFKKTLTAFIYRKHSDYARILALFKLKENGTQPTFAGATPSLPWAGETLTRLEDAPYRHYYNVYYRAKDLSTLYVEKKHCQDLHLCKQAIENCLRTEVLSNITTSKLYERLTDYEKMLVGHSIIKKSAALLEKK